MEPSRAGGAFGENVATDLLASLPVELHSVIFSFLRPEVIARYLFYTYVL